jgi:hypothetical protein
MMLGHSGDMGDTLWGCAALQLWAEDNAEVIELKLYDAPGVTSQPMTEQRAAVLLPLLAAQPYLVPSYSPDPVPTLLDHWRGHLKWWRTLAGAHLGALSYGRGAHTRAVERTWLTVPAGMSLPYGRRVVFARTHRYLSNDFPWREIVDWFGDLAIFLGLPSEWESFCVDHPNAVDRVLYVPTSDLLQAAQLIDCADFVVSNQTSLYAIAEGLKKPRVLESYLPMANCEYGSRNCLAIDPGTTITPERILELLTAPHTV